MAQGCDEVDALLTPLLASRAIDGVRRAIVLVAFAGLRLRATAALSWDDVDLLGEANSDAADGARVRNRRGVSEVILTRFVVEHLVPRALGFLITGGGRSAPDPQVLANPVGQITRGAGVKTIHAMQRAFLERLQRDSSS